MDLSKEVHPCRNCIINIVCKEHCNKFLVWFRDQLATDYKIPKSRLRGWI